MVESLRHLTPDTRRVESFDQFRRAVLERYVKCLDDPTLPQIISSVIKDAQALGLWQPPESPDEHNQKLLEIEPTAPVLSYGGFRYYPETRKVDTPSAKDIQLSPQEGRLFHVFMEMPNRTIPHKILAKVMWQGGFIKEECAQDIRVFIAYLRKKIGDAGIGIGRNKRFKYIRTISSYGYRLSVEGAADPEDTSKAQNNNSDKPSVDGEINGLMKPYFDFLSARGLGNVWTQVTPEDGEDLKDVKRRLTTAAEIVGKSVRYLRSPKGTIVFQAVEPQPVDKS